MNLRLPTPFENHLGSKKKQRRIQNSVVTGRIISGFQCICKNYIPVVHEDFSEILKTYEQICSVLTFLISVVKDLFCFLNERAVTYLLNIRAEWANKQMHTKNPSL